jgi:PPK2 family polyphosphate:nucleotide phosphotransferase
MFVTTFDKTDSKVRLSEISTRPPRDISREDAETRFRTLGDELFELQDLLWGARTHGVLIVLQGLDTAGKDGAIKHVAGCLNPRGISVVSFGVPTKEEIEHDFLWRIHKHTPRRGEFAIFNRSHYEDVLVVRVESLVPASIWKERYGHIRDFEELLVEHNTIVLKFFLHISKDEQEKRLLEREGDEKTAWKLNVNDWRTREKWDLYQEAYEDALRKTATERAPWHVVPADSKWFRNLAIATTVRDVLQPYKKIWRAKLDEMGSRAKAELLEYRRAQSSARKGS